MSIESKMLFHFVFNSLTNSTSHDKGEFWIFDLSLTLIFVSWFQTQSGALVVLIVVVWLRESRMW